ncbi:hypothetical protein F7647_10775 [Tenacibaculum piscium]|uniref:hypothetical protein n=1 Tax=Tenacibaculum piscium TaxID=1458515 RepID=UPI00187B8CE6|nr:hypothetical protein [Tenacibaculum piscium]MBE7686533.1 hypothetical protein [Tenacibaculum piscium]MBE7691238.1 hypothetical protein [Tenacibaculum piscium]
MFYIKSNSKKKNFIYSAILIVCFVFSSIENSNTKNTSQNITEMQVKQAGAPGFRIAWWHGFLDGIEGNTEIGLFGWCILDVDNK